MPNTNHETTTANGRSGKIPKHTNENNLLYLLLPAAFSILLIVQLLLGTGVLYIAAMMVSMTVIVLIVYILGVYNLSSILALALLTKYSLSPFLLKTFLGERIDEGLWAPEETFLIMTIGSVLVFLALIITASIPIKRRFLDACPTGSQLSRLGYLFYFFGFIFTLLHVHFTPRYIELGQQSAGFGGFGEFVGLLYLGVIFTTAHVALAKEKKTVNIALVVMFCGALGLSLLANAKVYFAMSLLSYMATFILYTPGYFRKKRGLKHLGYTALLLSFFVFGVTPAVHAVRVTGISGISSIPDRLEFISRNWIIAQGSGNQIARLGSAEIKYFDTIYNPLVDRLSMVEDLDLAVSRINSSNVVGFEPITLAIMSSIPSLLIFDKAIYNDVGLIGYVTGLAGGLGGYLRTTGVYAISYAMFMWPGWMFVVFFLYLIWFLYFKKIVHMELRGNIWAIYFLVKYGFLFTETGVQGMLQIMIRGVPVDIVTIYLILFIGRKLSNQSQPRRSLGHL